MRESSLLAHESIKPKKETHYKEIRSAMKRINKPCTSKMIAPHTYLDYHEVARRLSEMEKRGMIKVVGRFPDQKSKPLLWSLVDNNISYSLHAKCLQIDYQSLHTDTIRKLNSLKLSQRKGCENIGITRTTIHRTSKSLPITLDSFLKLVLWLDADINKYIIERRK